MTGHQLRERVHEMAERARERWVQLYLMGGADPARAFSMGMSRGLHFLGAVLEELRLRGVFHPGRVDPWPDQVPEILELPPEAPSPPDDEDKQ